MLRWDVRLLGLLALSLVLHAGLLAVLPGDGSWIEAVYARRVYPLLGGVVAFGPSRLPFSLTLTALLVLAVWVSALFARNLFRWRRGLLSAREAAMRFLLPCLAVAACLFHTFYLFWGYNYLRPPLEQRLGLGEFDSSTPARIGFSRRFIGDAVAARVPIGPWDIDELDELVDQAMTRALWLLEGRSVPVSSPIKGDLGTGILAMMGTRGFISGNTLEAHADLELPPVQLPFTVAHEKAHLAGFARERDANFVAWLALAGSADSRLRYSGYFGVFSYFLNSESRDLAAPLLRDREQLQLYSDSRVSRRVQRTSQRVYSEYLRANRIPDGMADYAQVWQLIQAWVLRDPSAARQVPAAGLSPGRDGSD